MSLHLTWVSPLIKLALINNSLSELKNVFTSEFCFVLIVSYILVPLFIIGSISSVLNFP